jgi:DNA modification methylase
MDLEVTYRPARSLVPHLKNARTHSDEQVDQIAASIRQFGWTNPILVDDEGRMIAGHGRLLAALKMDIDRVPTIKLSGMSDAQKRAYTIADNQLALNAGWDMTMLRGEIADLQGLGADLALLGFGADELRSMLDDRSAGLTDPDDVPAAEADPISLRGDVWVLGRHRLMCGDSTSVEDISGLMAGHLADLCFTSPPYGQQRDYSTGIVDWDVLMKGVFGALPVKQDAQVLVNLGMIHRDGEWMPYWEGWFAFMRTIGWRRFGWYVWDQGPGLPGDWNGRLAPAHEFVFHFNRIAEKARKTKVSKHAGTANHGTGLRGKDGAVSNYTAIGRNVQPRKIPDSVIRVMRHKARGIEVTHPAVFPVALVDEMLTAFSDPGDVVFEPFSGSGTQLISAEKNDRSCFAMEIAPVYVDVAVERWQLFTGRHAVLEASGANFNAQRRAA